MVNLSQHFFLNLFNDHRKKLIDGGIDGWF